jgi:hypothetical protein
MVGEHTLNRVEEGRVKVVNGFGETSGWSLIAGVVKEEDLNVP